MLVPISWLKEYVDLDLPLAQLAERLTLAGLEIEAIEKTGDWWDPETIVVGQILAVKPHPNADRLVLVDVDYGGGQPEQVVTGAPNLFEYKGREDLPVLKVAFARSGAVLIDAYSEQQPRPKKKLKPSKIRGIPSNGMVCSERELGLSDEHEGILLLPEDAPVGMPLRDYLGDEVLSLGLTVDMARCLNMIGVAREVAALTEARLHLPEDTLPATVGEGRAEDYVAVEIADPDLCNRYTGMIIRDVQIGESPKWMQERLTKAGMRPISNVVDITNYVMLEWGQPLHAFDYDLLLERAKRSGAEKPVIIVRRAHLGEKMTTLDGVERELDESMLLITDMLGPIAIAGVMGGAETEVNENTRNVLLESATFDNISNRRTAQKLKLPSEASQRFTRGIPATLNAIAARRAASLMHDYAQGKIVPGIVDTYPVPQEERVVYTTRSDIRRLLGMDLSLEEIAASLARLDFQCEQLYGLPQPRSEMGRGVFGLHIDEGEPLLRCVVPWHRLDISVPADLAEEVARVIGYDRIPMTLMSDTLPPQHRNLQLETEEKIRDILVGCGLQETISYSLTTVENHDKFNRGRPTAEEAHIPFVTLLNPLSAKRNVMRRSMQVSALENLAYNYRYTQRYAVFEVGKVYWPEGGDGVRPDEDPRLCILLTGPRRPVSLYPDPAGAQNFDFFDLKGIVETMLQRLGFSDEDVEYIPVRDNPTYTRTCALIKLKGESLGIMGELDPEVLLKFDIPVSAPVFAAEMHIKSLVRPSWQLQAMKPISNFPPVVEDLAFVVGEEVPAAKVLEAIRKAGGSLLSKTELFDIYRGKPLAEGQKSLAYHLTYESVDEPLKESQVVSARNRIIRRVSEAVGGTLRE
ncbi:MAG TPA: phenylalanine--tRNA ligase subunit beta [Ktedonobacteraceae bacterium]|nr:phenylalanine--tRNA ligase subunit beta [Ktedonobacteraceae bacterium]